MTLTAFDFNPGQKRDPDGKWGDGIAVPGGVANKSKIRVSSGSLSTSHVSSPDGERLRLTAGDFDGDSESGTDDASGSSADLSPDAVQNLNDRITVDTAKAKERQDDLKANWARLDELERDFRQAHAAARKHRDPQTLTYRPEDQSKIAAIQADLDQMYEWNNTVEVDDLLSEGVFPGTGDHDLVYQMWGSDDENGGWEFRLAPRPKGAPEGWAFPDPEEGDSAVLSEGEMSRFQRKLAEFGDDPKGQTAAFVAEFHLAGQHDQSSHGDGGGVSSAVTKLKSGGSVKLGAGESLARSDVVQQRGGGGALLAAVDTDDGARRVRLGVIGDEAGVPKWSAANKGATAELSPAQARALADGLTDSTRKARQQNAEADAVIEILEDGGWDPDDRNPTSEQRNLLDRHDSLTSGLVGNQQTITTPWGDVVYGTRVTDSGPSVALAVVSDDADADWTIDDAISDGTALDLTLAQVRALASKLRANAGTGQTAAVDTFQGDIPDQLADYWLRGKGAARVRWCTRGSFRRARRLLRGKVPAEMLDGTVANLYHRACGRWPGRGNEAALAAGLPDMEAEVAGGEYDTIPAEEVPETVGGNPDDGAYNRVYWNGPLAPIDIATGDRRKFAPGALSTRELPLPLRWQEKGAQGHDGAVVVGSLTGYDMAEDGSVVGGRGYFLDPAIIPDVRKAMHLVEHGVIGPSVDLEPDMDVTWVDEFGEAFDTQQCQVDGTCPDKPEALITRATIAGATLVPITAFAEARAPRLSDHGEFCLNPLHPGPCAGSGSGGGGGGGKGDKPKGAAPATGPYAGESGGEQAQAPGRGVIDALIREKFLDAPQTPNDDRTPEERAADEERLAEQARVQQRREQRAKVRTQAAQAREKYGPRSKWPKRVRANVEREEERVSQLAAVDEHAGCRPHEFCRTPLHPGPCKGWKRGSSKTADSPASKPAAKPKTAPKAAPAAKEPAAAKPSTIGKVTAAVKPRVMEADWKDHNDSLSKDQRQAVHDYTTSDYFAINNALKGTPPKTARERKSIEKTTALIRSSMAPAPRGTKVFRGTNTASIGLPKNPTLAEMRALVGKTLVNDAFTSTSVSADEIFAGNLELDIEMPEGTPSLWLNGNSRLPDEHEVLLDAGSRMQVLSVRESPAGSGNFKVKTRMTP